MWLVVQTKEPKGGVIFKNGWVGMIDKDWMGMIENCGMVEN